MTAGDDPALEEIRARASAIASNCARALLGELSPELALVSAARLAERIAVEVEAMARAG